MLKKILLVFILDTTYVVFKLCVVGICINYSLPKWIDLVASTFFAGILVFYYCKGKSEVLNSSMFSYIAKSLLLCFLSYVIIIPIWSTSKNIELICDAKVMFLSLDEYMGFMKGIPLSGYIYQYLLSMFIAPVVEEIIFRGILQKSLCKIKSPLFAILISAFLFSLTHYEIYRILLTFCSGLLFGYVYYKYGSILIPILGHSFWNILGFILQDKIQDITVYNVALYLCAILGFVLLFRNIWKSNVQKLNNE